MWSRVELKTKAKVILKRNYWMAVVVALILGAVIGGGSTFNSGDVGRIVGQDSDSIYNDFFNDSENNPDDFLNDGDDYTDDFNSSYSDYGTFEKIENRIKEFFDSPGVAAVISVVLIVVSIILIIAVLVSIFVLSVLEVGCQRWFIKNRKIKPEIGELVAPFKEGYLNVVGIQFFRGLFTLLWALLFIIPGIVKAYEYRMIPYLLAENPNMSRQEAFQRSKELMMGNKWNTFVLELSFIGWEILAACTFGILNVFYVYPYKCITNAELYVALCRGGRVEDDYEYQEPKSEFNY